MYCVDFTYSALLRTVTWLFLRRKSTNGSGLKRGTCSLIRTRDTAHNSTRSSLPHVETHQRILRWKTWRTCPHSRNVGNTVLCFENILSFLDSDHFFFLYIVPVSGSVNLVPRSPTASVKQSEICGEFFVKYLINSLPQYFHKSCIGLFLSKFCKLLCTASVHFRF